MSLIGQNPSCCDIEKLNNEIALKPEDQTLVLLLARETNSRFFAQTWIAQLIAHLVQRREGLTVRDYYHDWTEEKTLRRFTANIDGVAALVYSSIVEKVRLENRRQEPAPSTFYESLETRLKRTSRLENGNRKLPLI